MQTEGAGARLEPSVADLAAVRGGDADGLRALLSPALPQLYAFVARRSADAEEAAEGVADTLLLARSRAAREADQRLPLRIWLTRLAADVLASRIGADPVLLSGLDPDAPGLPLRLRAGLREVLPRLGREAWLAVGLRFGDSMGAREIARVLGKDLQSTRLILARAVHELAAASYPDRCITRPYPAELDAFVSRLLAGGPSDPPPGVGAELRAVLEVLVGASRLFEPPAADYGAVWRAVEGQGGEYLPGRPVRSAPAWLSPVMAGLLLVLGVAGAALWLLPAPPADPPPLVSRPLASAAIVPPGLDGGGAPPRRPRTAREWEPGARRGLVTRLSGRLYYADARPDSRLSYLDFGSEDPRSPALPRVIVDARRGPFSYSVSPVDGTLAYSTGGGLWTQDPLGMGPNAVLRDRDPAVTGSAGEFQVRAVAWHPRGHAVAFVDEPYSRPGPQSVYVYTPGGGASPGPPVAVLPLGDQASELSWSPNGDYLVMNTAQGAQVTRAFPRGGVASVSGVVSLGDRSAEWSPDARKARLLWSARFGEGPNTPFGIVDADGRHMRELGEAAHAVWGPGGDHVIYATYSDLRGVGAAFWRLDLGGGRPVQLGYVPGLDASARDVEFAPDGVHVAYSNAEGLWIADLHTGDAVRVPGVEGPVWRLSWKADPERYVPPPPNLGESGSVLYVAGTTVQGAAEREALAMLDLGSGGARYLHKAGRIEYTVSPDGVSVAIATDRSLELLDLRTEELTTLRAIGERSRLRGPAWAPSGKEIAYVEDVRTESGGLLRSRLVWQAVPRGARTVLLGAGSPGELRSVSYSPSGRWLLVEIADGWALLSSRGGELTPLPRAASYAWRPGHKADHLLRAADGATVVDVRGAVVHRLPGGVGAVRWLDRGRVLMLAEGSEALLYDVERRSTLRARVVPDRPDLAPLSPSGQWMLESTTGGLWARELSTGRREWLAANAGGFSRAVWTPYSPSVGGRPTGPSR